VKITIESCKNGAYAIFDDGENQEKLAYKFEDENPAGLQELLYDVKETLFCDSRYSQLRVFVSMEHGDKYECKGCDICGIKGEKND
jgi:hypothetical protein